MLDFSNTTFLIPFMVDNEDRIFNINVILKYLNNNIKTNVIIVEQGIQKTNTRTITKRSKPRNSRKRSSNFASSSTNAKRLGIRKSRSISTLEKDEFLGIRWI